MFWWYCSISWFQTGLFVPRFCRFACVSVSSSYVFVQVSLLGSSCFILIVLCPVCVMFSWLVPSLSSMCIYCLSRPFPFVMFSLKLCASCVSWLISEVLQKSCFWSLHFVCGVLCFGPKPVCHTANLTIQIHLSAPLTPTDKCFMCNHLKEGEPEAGVRKDEEDGGETKGGKEEEEGEGGETQKKAWKKRWKASK